MAEFVDNNKASAGASVSNNQQQMQIIIHDKENDKYYWPAVQEGVTWDLTWKGSPGKLTFKVLADKLLNFHEGDTVQANFGGTNFFKGFVFTKKRSKEGIITVTAYDQIRYLKNKETYIFTNKTASAIIKQIVEDFQLKKDDDELFKMNTGTAEEGFADTGYVIPKYRGSNKTLLDIIQTTLDMTTENTGRLYVFYDDFGKLMLKDLEQMEVKIVINDEAAQDFSYSSDIDKDTYNQVKLFYDNKETGKRDVWMSQDSANIKRWGLLRLTESVNPKKGMNFGQMADVKLKLGNRVKRSLSISGAFGDLRVRGGSMLYVDLNLGDVQLTKKVIVESVKHKFDNGLHTMDLTVKGDVITG